MALHGCTGARGVAYVEVVCGAVMLVVWFPIVSGGYGEVSDGIASEFNDGGYGCNGYANSCTG